jgi:hypothetical protein
MVLLVCSVTFEKVVQDEPEKVFGSDPIFGMCYDPYTSSSYLKKNNKFFWDVTPCSPLDVYQRFGVTCCRHLLP